MAKETWALEGLVQIVKGGADRKTTSSDSKGEGASHIEESGSSGGDEFFEKLMEAPVDEDEVATRVTAKAAEDLSKRAPGSILEGLTKDVKEGKAKAMSDDLVERLQAWASTSSECLVASHVKEHFYCVPSTETNIRRAGHRLIEGRLMLGAHGQQLRGLFMGRRTPRQERQLTQGKKLDAANLFRTKTTPKGIAPGVWCRDKEGRVKSTAVSIILDQSGSMGLGHYRGSKAAVSEALVLGLGEMLDQMRIPWECIGFTFLGSFRGKVRTAPMDFSLIKTFEEPRVVPFKAMWPDRTSNNGDYDALHIALPRLLARREEVRILFHIGDGEICTGNSAWDKLSTTCFIRDIKEARALGVHCFGFGIDEDLSYLFGKAGSVTVDASSPGRFAAEMVTKLKTMILGA